MSTLLNIIPRARRSFILNYFPLLFFLLFSSFLHLIRLCVAYADRGKWWTDPPLPPFFGTKKEKKKKVKNNSFPEKSEEEASKESLKSCTSAPHTKAISRIHGQKKFLYISSSSSFFSRSCFLCVGV